MKVFGYVMLFATAAGRLEAEYEAFRKQNGRDCTVSNGTDSTSCAERLALYEKFKDAVDRHNSGDSLWKASVNKFADYTPAEVNALLGYRRVGRWFQARSSGSASMLQVERSVDSQGEVQEASSLVEIHAKRNLRDDDDLSTMDWRTKGLVSSSSEFILNQGGCGSCWAMASVGALEMHREIAGGPAQRLSWAQLVDCVPNPQECGGNGGCGGATAELAFEYVKFTGLSTRDAYHGSGISKGSTARCEQSTPAISSVGWVRLPENAQQPLLEAVTNEGPVVVSVAADGWTSYLSGIYDSCDRDAVINHAVLLVGYGSAESKSGSNSKYWLVRNSWGSDWGESGYIRIQRFNTDQGQDGYCGIDRDPKQGVGCNGGPPTLPVCGMCGILSDSSYPTKVGSAALLQTEERKRRKQIMRVESK